MRKILSLLFQSEGFVSGRTYLSAGVVLFLLKYGIDAVLVWTWFGQVWRPWDYLNIRWRDVDFRDLAVVRFATIMLALALPFIWCGVTMTVKRLRSIGWNPALVLLFFIPYLNIPFLFLISFLPDGHAPAPERPEREVNGAVLMVVLVTILAVGCVVLATVLLEHYGWGLFVGIPFLIGFVPGLLHKTSTTHPVVECMMVGVALELFVGVALILFALEGLICLIMAAPIAAALNALGALIGYNIRKAANWRRGQRELFCGGTFLFLAMLLFAEKSMNAKPPLLEVKTTVDITAPSSNVWKHVVTFSELAAPTEWIFHAGVAHPLKAEIEGRGVGAVRHCIFSTGTFVEPIEVWDEPRLLRFTVTSNPPPMRELSFRPVKPAHLEGFLLSERGQFELTAVSANTTRLEGTTWYRHGLWPARYWQLWSDYIIHTIHLRVLRHIKAEAEAQSQRSEEFRN
jgi:hypothetical protein